MYNLSDWEEARILGKRAFYERSTKTIRACPENYCLAVKGDGGWHTYGRDNAIKSWWPALDKAILTYGILGVGSDSASSRRTLPYPCSLSGVELDGDSIVRMVYLDESGISINESFTVVAGVIIDADKQWNSVAEYLNSLLTEYVPVEHHHGFVFHAKELFHGSKVFDPKRYPPKRRRELLTKIVEIPSKFRLPTAYGYSDKIPLQNWLRRYPKKKQQRDMRAIHHAVTYSYCAIAVERYMRETARPEELAELIAENNDDARARVKEMHHILRGRNLYETTEYLYEIGKRYLPVRKFIGSVRFAEKDDDILLQIADACAFTYRLYLEKRSDASDLFCALSRNNPAKLEPQRCSDGGLGGYTLFYF